MLARYLTMALHSQRSISPRSEKPEPRRGVARAVLAIVFGIALCFNCASAYAPSWQENEPSLKRYALIHLGFNKSQYKCLNNIYSKESAWNTKAHNKAGGAYGIPQLKSKYVQNKSGFVQIDLGLKYIYSRYNTPCKAWKHWKVKRWY